MRHLAARRLAALGLLSLIALVSALGDPLGGDPLGGDPLASALASPTKGPAPGVILVVVDTLRFDALNEGPLQDRALSAPMPFLRELGHAGVSATQHSASSSWTKTAYASILTGLSPREHGLLAPEAALSPALRTLPERLPGVRSAAFLGNPLAGRRHGFAQGFEHVHEPEDPRDLPSAEALVDAALSWLDGVGEAPFLLVLMPFEPHAPYAPPDPLRGAFCPDCGPGTLDAPEREYRGPGPGPEAVRKLQQLYLGEAHAVDRALARLSQGLAGRGLDRRVTWVLTADHGEALGEHGVFGHAFHLWDEVLRVPLVLSGRGVPPRVDLPGVSSHVDLLPTLLALFGLPADPSLPGVDLLSPYDPHRVALAEVELYGIRRLSARSASTKTVFHAPLQQEVFARYYDDPGLYPSVARGQPRIEHFDLEADPEEARDLGEQAARAHGDTWAVIQASLSESE